MPTFSAAFGSFQPKSSSTSLVKLLVTVTVFFFFLTVTSHPSRISRELAASRSLGTKSLGTKSDVLAVATCTGGVTGGSVCDESADATFTNDSGSSEAAVVSVLDTNSAATATSALPIGALLVSVAGGGAYAK